MSITAGNFTPSALMEINAFATQVFSDDVRRADVTPESEAARVILSLQTAKFEMLKDPEKDREIKLYWSQNCELSVDDDTDQCIVAGSEAGSDSKTYGITNRKKVEFKVKREEFRTNMLDRQMVVARQFAEALKAMDEHIAQFVPAWLEDNLGTNVYYSDRGFTLSGGYTIIPAASWTPDLMSYFVQVQRKNRLGAAFMLSGDLMWNATWKAMMEQANADGKGAANKMGSFQIFHDHFNVDSVIGAKAMFIVNPSSVALVSKSRYSAVPITDPMIQQTRYKISSPSLPGVEYDVIYTAECSGDDIIDKWKIVSRYDMFLNPTGCTAGRTGILGMKCS